MYYRQPRYFKDFHCIGGACGSDSCCYNWKIFWYEDEINKLKSSEKCSPELREIIERSFVPHGSLKEWYEIEFDEHGRCPFLSENELCRIQKELGAEYLSDTCTTYPRKYFISESVVYSMCFSSCREIMRHLISNEKAMDLINVPIKETKTIRGEMDSPEKLAAHPELKFRAELFEFFYEIIAEKRHNVETNIILGALAAQTLTKLVERGEINNIPETVKALKAQMHNSAQLKTIENIKPNYHLRFGFMGWILREIVGNSMINLLNDQTGTPNIDYYNTASARLEEIFKDRPFYLRNIALNLLLEIDVPFKFPESTIFENYSLFAVAYSCIKLNMISIAITGKDGKFALNQYGNQTHYSGDDRFIALTSKICRHICQNNDNQKSILEMLDKFNFTSPAYLALLVK